MNGKLEEARLPGNHQPVSLDDIIITAELSQRPSRSPNLEAENQALVTLAKQWASEPGTILQALVETAVKLCQADTAGISLLEQCDNGEEVFRWVALAGVHKDHIFGSTPRDFSPCGTCLDRNAPQLYEYPGRYFTYFVPLDPPIVEGLVIPFYVGGRAAGTIWIVSHDNRRLFDCEDVRIMTSLAQFTAASWQVSLAWHAAEANAQRARQAEQSLRISEERFRIALKNAPIIVFNQDPDLRYTWIYNSLPALSSEQVLGKQDQELWEDAQPVEAFKCTVLETGVGGREEIHLRCDRFDRFYDLTIEPLRDADGRITGITGAAFDITARKQAEEQAQQHLVQLAHMARLSLAGEMASGLAHEINQPLGAIVTYTEACLRLLRSGKANPDTLIKTMEEVATQGLRAGEIIHYLRNLVRKGETHRSAVAINRLIQEVARLAKIEARQHEVQIRLQLATALPLVFANNIQIQQVLLNLIRNGIEAMSSTEVDQRKLTIQTVCAENNTIEVRISDTGPGLSADIMDKLFQPYFTTKPTGMGLGLSISQSIIEAHRGRLWVTPNADQGVTFHFTLPYNLRKSSR